MCVCARVSMCVCVCVFVCVCVCDRVLMSGICMLVCSVCCWGMGMSECMWGWGQVHAWVTVRR